MIKLKNKFPVHYQLDSVDCGPTCLRMICEYYGKKMSLERLRELTNYSRGGVSILGIKQAAEDLGFETMVGQTVYEQLKLIDAPFIAHWNYDHFIVVYKITDNKVYTADPTAGLINYHKDEFIKYWGTEGNIKGSKAGIVLLLGHTDKVEQLSVQHDKASNQVQLNGLKQVFGYLFQQKTFLLQLALSLIGISLFQLLTPFLTQAIVDLGIAQKDVPLINMILLGQLFLFVGRISLELFRRWVLLHLSTRINISMVSSFLSKLMRLPLTFFDAKQTGDILRRIEDHRRIELFLSASTLNIVFSLFSLIAFGIVLFVYDLYISIIFFIFSCLYIAYTLLFLKKRAEIDYKRFTQNANTNSTLIEAIDGMPDIKLNNSQEKIQKRWEDVQAYLFGVNIESNKLLQLQEAGGLFINEIKNILITFMAANAVINGQITLGMMLSMQYIIGQLNVPLNGIIEIVKEWHDAKLSLERIGEIHNLKEEKAQGIHFGSLTENPDISLKNVSFQYEDKGSRFVLKDINLTIPQNKVTAIVGTSGSGKTTLLKILLRFFEPTYGSVYLGDTHIDQFSIDSWRNACGVVMQENYIFSDSVLNNVTLSSEFPDMDRFIDSINIANIETLIRDMPMGYHTKIGRNGMGMSAGQKQRLLIARAVYKDPRYIFLDEATSALDANNEKAIVNNLNQFFRDRTVIVIAHRLSTVRNADQIVVMEEGSIVEIGDHLSLVEKRGKYYELVQNQLDL